MKADHRKEIERQIPIGNKDIERLILIGDKWIWEYQFTKRISANELHEMFQKIHQKAIKQANEDIKVMKKMSDMPNVSFLLRDGKFSKKRFLDAMYMIRVGAYIEKYIIEEIETDWSGEFRHRSGRFLINTSLEGLGRRDQYAWTEAGKLFPKDQVYVVFFQTEYPLP